MNEKSLKVQPCQVTLFQTNSWSEKTVERERERERVREGEREFGLIFSHYVCHPPLESISPLEYPI